ncbi:MAG: aldo/keto reductase [Microbacteriaceae bacterium]|nr:aldo/keto reductase [Microbacteriaceae bacterium]
MSELHVPAIQLNDGNLIPQLGLGVWRVDDAVAERVVSEALEIGYRHIDTASFYQNERAVGRAIAASGISRDELFVTTKLWNTDQRDPHGAFHASLERLGLDKIDLYLVHWPVPTKGTAVGAWRGLIELVGSPECDSIGVSNFEIEHLTELQRETGVVAAVNQIELHPLHQRRELREFCADRGIAVAAWGPLGQGITDLLQRPAVTGAAAAHGKTPAQVVIRWHLQHGTIVFPKTTHRERMIENAAVFDFALSEAEMAAIDALDAQHRLGGDPYVFTGE